MGTNIETSTYHLKVGQRFIAKGSNGGQNEFFTVLTEGERNFSAVNAAGTKISIKEWQGLKSDDGRGFYSTWTSPFPNLSDDKILEYVATVKRSAEANQRHQNSLLLIYVKEGSQAGKFMGNFAYSSHRNPDDYEDISKCAKSMGIDLTTEAFGDTTVLKNDVSFDLGNCFGQITDVSAGDLLLAGDFRAELVDNKLSFNLVRPVSVLASGLEMGDLSNYIPFERERDEHVQSFVLRSHLEFFNDGDFLEEYSNAKIRLDPDEGLVFWCKDPNDKDSTHCMFLGHTGWTLHNAAHDCIEDYFYGSDVEMGLWLCANPKWWSYTSYEGEHDAGVDCDWVPASLADLERYGFDKASLVDEIREYLDESGFAYTDETIVEELIMMANKACKKDEVEVPTP